MDKQTDNCEVCYKIKCKNCGWEPDDLEIQRILKNELKNCPACGWNPSS